MEKPEPLMAEMASLLTSLTQSTEYDFSTYLLLVKPKASVQQAAVTRIQLDGDTEVVIPMSGDRIDQQIMESHQQNVQYAMERRAKAIDCLTQNAGLWSESNG